MFITGKVNTEQFRAIAFFSEELCMPEVNVHIRFTKKIPTYGYTDVIDDDLYEIVIDSKLDDREKIITIAHEMVHVKQFAIGDLSLDCTTWKNTKDFSGEPWEDEAEELSHILTKQFYATLR